MMGLFCEEERKKKTKEKKKKKNYVRVEKGMVD